MTITPELEAVARAICRENLLATKQPTDDGTINSYWLSFEKEARAALLAIREPTDEMLAAMSRTHPANTTTRWNIAIDHILGAKP